jgi:hypothetical protein
MKYNSVIISLVASSLLFSCNLSVKEGKELTVKTEASEIKVVANRMLIADIEGMVCKMGCGGSIRKEMLKTEAIESCEFDFEEERKENVVKIAFDKEKISADKIVSILNTINDKQFTISKVETSTIEKTAVIIRETKHNNCSSNKEESQFEVSEVRLETPNLLQLFSRLITG